MKLFEMARSRKEIAHTLQEKSSQIFIHLIKYFYVDDNGLRDHWSREIYSFLNDIDILKSTKDYPTLAFIYENTYVVHADSICKKQKKILSEYESSSIKERNDEKFLDFASNYFYNLSDILSKEGYVSQEEINNILRSSLS